MSHRHIIADEIGVDSALVAGWRLQSTHSPVYARAGALGLKPVAVICGTAGSFEGKRPTFEMTELEHWLGAGRARSVALSLDLRSYRSAGGTDLDIFVNLHARLLRSASLVDAALARLGEIGVTPDRIVAFIDASDELNDAVGAAARKLSQAGVRLGFSGAGGGQQGDGISPAVARLDHSWLRNAAMDGASLGLLTSYVRACHALGRKVLAPSLRSAVELRTAHDIGCDLFEGPALAERRVAGAEIDMSERQLPQLACGAGPNVVRFALKGRRAT